MKKAISLVLAIILCLSLCACGSTNKYVGTYKKTGCYFETFDINDGIGKLNVEYELTLSSDGSGRLVMKSLDNNSKIRSAAVGDEGIKIGDILIDIVVTWEETENYITISGSGKNWLHLSYGYLTDKRVIANEEELSETKYRLDGDHLVPISGSGSEYTKVG